MLLRERIGSAPKVPGSFDRTTTIEETLSHEPLLRRTFCITRIAEITHLDRIGIPVFSAIVPDSPELIGVYNGKGTTREAARAGALMEAVERQAAAHARSSAMSSFPVEDLLDDTRRFTALERRHATSGARYPQRTSSNGIAAGNTTAEAIYHALTELIERHVWSVVDAIAHLRPNKIFSMIVGRDVMLRDLIDDRVTIEFTRPTGSAIIDELLTRIAGAGLRVVLRAVELRPFPHLFVATIVEEHPGLSPFYTGLGCSLSPEHAAIRALTEAAQSRVADMQGAREDLLDADAPPSPVYNDHNRRRSALPSGRWFFDAPSRPTTLPALPDRSFGDIARDIETLLAMLRAADLHSAVVADLTPAALPVSIVRLFVPGLENTALDDDVGPTIAAILDTRRYPPVLDHVTR